MKKWDIKYKDHDIRVENGWFSGERLYVDGELQDEQVGFGFRSRLYGKIKNHEGAGEDIKVSLGGWSTINCRIFINGKLIFPNNVA